MGTACTAAIPAGKDNPSNNIFRLALVRVVPLFLSVADYCPAGRCASRDEKLSRILECICIPPHTRGALLALIPRVLCDRSLRAVHACVDGPAKTVSIECARMEHSAPARIRVPAV